MNSTGASNRALLAHKARGFMQVLYDIGPKRFVIGVLALAMGMLLFGVGYFLQSLNPRLLHGSELQYAALCYAEIHQADQDAEWDAKVRDESVARAEIALGTLQGYARSKEAIRAHRVLRYYLESVTELPRIDQRCTVLRIPVMPDSQQALLEQSVPFFRCLSQRATVERNIRQCRNEAQSYLEMGHQPPVDSCIYNVETPLVDRR